MCYFSYTPAVALKQLDLVVIREVFPAPVQRRTERGKEERPKWGASPAKPCEPLRRSVEDAVHSLG